ncbi:hypothetical protein DPMN_115562 [Dreissena polymorpha]|uniref:Uncharacterized protein n=1 Tax=Dreissena polymorpha TaxID=45954 RepID=A0A9D4KM97_DREPO|nr:hypothetical protein DPMN_115562 [Dreissena polymorpha]
MATKEWGIYLYMAIISGFPANLEIRESLEKDFHFFQSGKSQGILGKVPEIIKNQGILFGQTFQTYVEKSI